MVTKIKMLRSWQGWEKNEKYEMDSSTANILLNLGYAEKEITAAEPVVKEPVSSVDKIKTTKKARIENVK